MGVIGFGAQGFGVKVEGLGFNLGLCAPGPGFFTRTLSLSPHGAWPFRIGILTGPKPKEIKAETFRIHYLIRSPKVEKLGFEPVSI